MQLYQGEAVECDTCSEYFTPKPHERSRDDGGVTIAFSCPNGHEYIVAQISKKGVEVRREYARLSAKPGNLKRKRELREILKQEVTRS